MLRLTFIFLLTGLMFSCTSEPCDDVNCGENGVCVTGMCECNDFFEGNDCQTFARNKFLGMWNTSSSNCTDLDDVDILPNVIVEAQPGGGMQDLRFQIPDLIGSTWVQASLTDNNNATFSTSIDSFAISGALNFSEDLTFFSLDFTADVTCNFNLTK